MCLGVPGRVLRWLNREPLFEEAEIDFGGVTRRCPMACVPDAEIGDYVVVHAGVAIARLDVVAAEMTNAAIASLLDGGQTKDGGDR
jgi:hydrogenase expression/formation protein HypC